MRCRTPNQIYVLLGLLSACSPAPKVQSVWDPERSHPVPTPPEESKAEPPSDEILVARMHRRLQTITAMRDELLLGDDEAVRVLATDLADDLRTNPKPERWHELVAPMISDLEQAQTLASVEALAPSVARLAVRCGNCHRTLDPPITLPEFVHPPDGDSPKERMQQHLWAADRMWEGLIGPSTERWVRGTTVFTVLPGCGGASSDEQPERAKLCARVQSLVRHGHAETSTGGQGDVYGRLLATCAACHALEP